MNLLQGLVQRVRSRVDRYQRNHCAKRIARRSPTRPIVTFTFDDFPRSAFCQGGAILQQYGARGTYYVSLGLMDSQRGDVEFCRLEDLRRLLEDGHELGCHTYGHLKCSETKCRSYERDIVKNADEAARLFDGYRFRHFAYPFGDVTGRHKRMLARHFQTLRTIEGGENVGPCDLNRLRANRLYSGSVAVEKALQMIDDNARQAGWLIFYTHDVCQSPSRFGCTPEYFEEVVAAASRSGSDLLTIGAASERLD